MSKDSCAIKIRQIFGGNGNEVRTIIEQIDLFVFFSIPIPVPFYARLLFTDKRSRPFL